MSGAVAAHAAYNGSGTQGLAVTNKIDGDEGDVTSAFWNKNDTTRQLLHGAALTEIPSSGASALTYGSSRIFTVNNDIDCLGDMYLQISASFPFLQTETMLPQLVTLPSPINDVDPDRPGVFMGGFSPDVADGSANAVQIGLGFQYPSVRLVAKPFSMQSIVSRVEIQVGTQIWQTLENEDLRVISASEMTSDAFAELASLTSPVHGDQAQIFNAPSAEVNTAWLVIPSLSKTLGPAFGKFANQTEDGYPMAAAPHQSVKIKVHFRDFPSTLTYPPFSFDPGYTERNLELNEDVPFTARFIDGATRSTQNYFQDENTLTVLIDASGEHATATGVSSHTADASGGHFVRLDFMSGPGISGIYPIKNISTAMTDGNAAHFTVDLSANNVIGVRSNLDLSGGNLLACSSRAEADASGFPQVAVFGNIGGTQVLTGVDLDTIGPPFNTALIKAAAEQAIVDGSGGLQFYLNAFPLSSDGQDLVGAGGLLGRFGGGSITACNLYAKQIIMCNEEREQIKNMPEGLPKRFKMTQNSHTTDIGSSLTKTIELDHFSLYASHLVISGDAGPGVRLKSLELKLNSSSYSGQLPGVLLDACTADSIGVFANKIVSANGSGVDVSESGIGTYVFPLAAAAYGGSSVPLNRFDSVRLTLTFTSNPTQSNATFINVTCCGETTALFKGGSASLAMY